MSERINEKLKEIGAIKQKVRIDILRPTDLRGITVKSKNETDLGIHTKAYGQDPFIIWKHGPGWSFPKNVTKYLAIEGTPLTTYTDKQIEKTASVPEFLALAWDGIKDDDGNKLSGEVAYNRLLPALRNRIEGKFGATVTVQPAKMEKGAAGVLSIVRVQEILKDSSVFMANLVTKYTEKKDPWKDAMTDVVKYAFGGFLFYFLEHALGVFN